ncbi:MULTISPECIES: hypothetical protein [Citrobacter]|uniref:Uncharacterized protein n=1 Tax=Citrobacter telavivensis TaxID=2653932 RepID=A0A6L5EBE6_9ENTR|nr:MULTISPECIES: hypothetical protein [Citrobacter]MPQ52666.1 hypothetical protein [Citrobacter telavivensis]QFS69989.1 hypothetical protein GBC03_07115 [Citrobacter telavivensis]CAI9388882.1 hypothetical protein CITSP_00655 [Citrobacter sp. T1.2D-1]
MSDPFTAVRQAHRICAAYYQQLFPLLNETAQKLDTTFLVWNTWSFNKPPQSNKNPFESWKWDYLPIMDVSFVFSRQHEPGTPMTTRDYVLDFKLITDSELLYEQRQKQYGKNSEPLATELKISAQDAKSYLCIYLFSPTENDATYATPYTLWNSYDGYPEPDESIYFSDNKGVKGTGILLPLYTLAQKKGCEWLVDKINTQLTHLLSYKES